MCFFALSLLISSVVTFAASSNSCFVRASRYLCLQSMVLFSCVQGFKAICCMGSKQSPFLLMGCVRLYLTARKLQRVLMRETSISYLLLVRPTCLQPKLSGARCLRWKLPRPLWPQRFLNLLMLSTHLSLYIYAAICLMITLCAHRAGNIKPEGAE